MTEPNEPAHRAADPAGGAGITRRRLLVGLGLAGVSATGLGVGLARPGGLRDPFDTQRALPDAPITLRGAVAREYGLINGLRGSALAGDPRVVAVLADHEAHAQALAQILARYRGSQSPSSLASTSVSLLADPVALADSERAAGAAASADSAGLSGTHADLAVLLASIAASEASHAELFT